MRRDSTDLAVMPPAGLDSDSGVGGVAARAVAAYGGAERWRRAETAAVTVSATGWAFRMKMCPPLTRARAEAQVHRPFIRSVWGRDLVAVFDAGDVRLEDAAGHTLAERTRARRVFPYGRRALWWDRLDFVYFCGYALWNYLTLPALLSRADVEWRAVGAHTLEARFPEQVPTHSPVQRYHFDPATGLLRQHDYTVDVMGSWAKVAHVVLGHGHTAQDLPFTSHRRALRRRADGSPAPWPTLVDIHLQDFDLRAAS